MQSRKNVIVSNSPPDSNWKFACISSGEHLEKILDAYEELGIGVYLQRVNPVDDNGSGCSVCFSGEQVFRVFTKRD